MKHYIFLQRVIGSGGVQCYIAAKTRYLEENGWHVVVIGDNNPNTPQLCMLPYLNKFIPNGNLYTYEHPDKLPYWLVNRVTRKMCETVGHVAAGEEVLIESWNSSTAMWGELLAKRLHGRHLFWTANEYYRTPGNQYEPQMDFYLFKMRRGEILTSIDCVNRLFAGYKQYAKGDFIEFYMTEDPIQDVHFDKVDNLEKKDWNICYIGRSNKPYVPNIIKGVVDFANRHQDLQVQLILVGDASSQNELLNAIKCENLIITKLGNLFPIPRKVDVVIAGSGSARHSVDEGALVVSTDVDTCRSHGILGYDTLDSISAQNPNADDLLDLSFEDALERALITKEWLNKPFVWKKMPGIKECIKRQKDIISKATSDLEYYNERKLLSGKTDWLLTLKCLLVFPIKEHMPQFVIKSLIKT